MISIHALREEGDIRSITQWDWTRRFLSTPSARRATQPSAADLHRVHISIHALREEGDDRAARGHKFQSISIHALREEGDLCIPCAC